MHKVPRPLTAAEFQRRWREGKRTLPELDPDFWAWYQRSRRLNLFAIAAAWPAGVVFLIALLLVIWAGEAPR